ncbi:MAG: isoaspartyl peptidase/L-asparaginase family protein [Pseudomonadota bacterium]|jgi:beta-aspartyl-peptidase (threonine type)
MKTSCLRLATVAILAAAACAAHAADIVLAVHGGAGAIPRAELTAEKESAIRAELEAALRAGAKVLAGGGSSLDAVTRAVVMLEDSPHFNAGKGAVFNSDGINELDASIMDGHTRRAGAVAGLQRIRNPIELARAVMEKSRHVMMVGAGAEQFARSVGIAFVDPSYFRTEERWQQLLKAREKEKAEASLPLPAVAYYGTVGAVARDREDRLAAATSTGGMTNKRFGRVGDAPIIGAGTWADGKCAVSATGWGEYFIRSAVAHDLCARVAYRGDAVAKAADEVLAGVAKLGGDGGVIVLDADGNAALSYNSAGMYRGTIDADGTVSVAIYAD